MEQESRLIASRNGFLAYQSTSRQYSVCTGLPESTQSHGKNISATAQTTASDDPNRTRTMPSDSAILHRIGKMCGIRISFTAPDADPNALQIT